MGRRTITRAIIAAACLTSSAHCADAFKHVGDYLLRAHFKLAGDKMTPIPTKPIAFRVYTDGVKVKIKAEGDEESQTTFDIYRSDGIGRQRRGGGALEVIPGLQATCNTGGIMRHLRLSRESMTITSFPAVSDQTIVSYSVAAEPAKTESNKTTPASPNQKPVEPTPPNSPQSLTPKP